MLNRSASLAMSTSVLKTLPGKLDIKRHSPSILYISIAIYTKTVITLLQVNIIPHWISKIDWKLMSLDI